DFTFPIESRVSCAVSKRKEGRAMSKMWLEETVLEVILPPNGGNSCNINKRKRSVEVWDVVQYQIGFGTRCSENIQDKVQPNGEHESENRNG
ncbi:hypothetical protein MKX01_021951, partial [Papaver californicum]